MIIKFNIPGKAQAKQRARITRSGNYTPEKTENAEAFIKRIAYGAMNGAPPMEGAIKLCVTVYRRIPKSFSKLNRMKAEAFCLRPATRPDLDNQIKLIKDALNSICWKDDAQVCQLYAEKRYGEPERTEIRVEEW